MSTLKDLEKRLDVLEKAFLSSQKDVPNAIFKADSSSISINETMPKVEQNTTDISDNRDGIMESFENSMLNTEDISSLRSGLEEVYEMLLESEVTE